MKLIEERTTHYPPHALCKSDIQTIMGALPVAWTEDIKRVRLSAALGKPIIADYSSYNGTLTVASRGRTKESTVAAILSELCAKGLDIPYQRWHHLTFKDRSKINRIIGPLTQSLLPLLSRKKIWLEEHPPQIKRE